MTPTMAGENIVCFAKDWDDDPTSNTHVMRLLARDNRVLWLNSIGMRRPSVGSARDLRRIFRRLGDFGRGAREAAPNLWVASPPVIPLPHSPLATRLNRALLRSTVARLRRQLGMRTFQLWTFLPNVAAYTDLGQSLLVYYCVDNWLHMAGADGDGQELDALERELCRRADLVFATSRYLVDAKRRINPETHLASHGVDHAHFAAALDPHGAAAPELADVTGPVLGVVGLIDGRVDVELLGHVADRHPSGRSPSSGRWRSTRRRFSAARTCGSSGGSPTRGCPRSAGASRSGSCRSSSTSTRARSTPSSCAST
jgi:hypothetical protein